MGIFYINVLYNTRLVASPYNTIYLSHIYIVQSLKENIIKKSNFFECTGNYFSTVSLSDSEK